MPGSNAENIIRRKAQAQRIAGAEAMFRAKREKNPPDIRQALGDAVTQAIARADVGGTLAGARAQQFAAANPNSLTARLLEAGPPSVGRAVSGALSQSPEQRLGQVGSGQFRGSEVTKRRMRRGLRRRLGA